MQAAQYLTATRGLGAPEARICYERAEPLCHLLNRPLPLCVALIGRWRYTVMTDKVSAAMQIAERIYSLAQEQNDAALMIEAYRALAATLYFLGNFESARQYARRGVQIWRSGNVRSYAENPYSPAVVCLGYEAMSGWYLGEVASSKAKLDEAISLAKELNDIGALAFALSWTAIFGIAERNLAEVDRLAADLIELSTRHNFLYWLALGTIYRGWARSASGYSAEGIPCIEQGIRDFRATGSVLRLPCYLILNAEALYLADRTSKALEAINEAEALVERFEERELCAELDRFRGVFLATMGADEAQIEASFSAAIKTAREQKSVLLKKRAEATDAEYRRQKASGLRGRGFRLPLG